jgi:acyl-CoA thioester hydrolase
MKEYLYKLEMKTRDYECDAQGVVNNANYQHYLEVTRHEWLLGEGFSFRKWHDEGIDVMVSEINIKYKTPLRGQEEFVSCLNLRREGPRFIFDQDIYRKDDGRLCVSAQVTTVCVINGRLTRGDEIAPHFEKYLK